MSINQRIYKTAMFLGDDASIFSCHTIEHEGAFWLVPSWLVSPDKTRWLPERIVRLNGSDYQKVEGQPIGLPPDTDFLLSHPIPRDVFEGRNPTPEKAGFVVIDRPDIVFDSPAGRQ